MAKKIKTNHQQVQEWIDCAKTPPFVSQPGTDGPRAWVEPGETGQDRQPQAGAVETATAPVHRATPFRAFWQTTPDSVVSVEERCRVEGRKREASRAAGSSVRETAPEAR
jgi:hypothetical protein